MPGQVKTAIDPLTAGTAAVMLPAAILRVLGSSGFAGRMTEAAGWRRPLMVATDAAVNRAAEGAGDLAMATAGLNWTIRKALAAASRPQVEEQPVLEEQEDDVLAPFVEGFEDEMGKVGFAEKLAGINIMQRDMLIGAAKAAKRQAEKAEGKYLKRWNTPKADLLNQRADDAAAAAKRAEGDVINWFSNVNYSPKVASAFVEELDKLAVFKSEAQRRWMHAAEARGKLKKGTAARWERHTPDNVKLPEHVKQSAAEPLPWQGDGAFDWHRGAVDLLEKDKYDKELLRHLKAGLKDKKNLTGLWEAVGACYRSRDLDVSPEVRDQLAISLEALEEGWEKFTSLWAPRARPKMRAALDAMKAQVADASGSKDRIFLLPPPQLEKTAGEGADAAAFVFDDNDGGGEIIRKVWAAKNKGAEPNYESIDGLKVNPDRLSSMMWAYGKRGVIDAAEGFNKAENKPFSDEDRKWWSDFLDSVEAVLNKSRPSPAKAPETGQMVVKEAAVKVGPPPERNRKEYPYTGTIQFQDLPEILVENEKGSTRSGTGPDGKTWSTTMPAHYGEFRRTMGTDGDPVDVYVGPDATSTNVYVVHTMKPPTFTMFDEDKVFLGFGSVAEVKECMLKAYDDKRFFGSVSSLSVEDLKKVLKKRSARGEKLDQDTVMAKAASALWLGFNDEVVGFGLPSGAPRALVWAART